MHLAKKKLPWCIIKAKCMERKVDKALTSLG
jgi:hypothetical protein